MFAFVSFLALLFQSLLPVTSLGLRVVASLCCCCLHLRSDSAHFGAQLTPQYHCGSKLDRRTDRLTDRQAFRPANGQLVFIILFLCVFVHVCV